MAVDRWALGILNAPEKSPAFSPFWINMRICHLINEFWYGGIQETVLALCHGLPDMQHWVLGYSDGPMKKEFDVLENVTTECNWNKDYTLLREFVLRERIDIVHKQMGGGDESKMLQELCGPRVCRIVESIHCPRDCKTPTHAVDAVCLASQYTQSFQTRDLPFTIVPYGSTPVRPQQSPQSVRQQLQIPEDAFVIGRVGRLSGNKLVHDTVLVLDLLRHKCPNMYCVIAGSVPRDEGPQYYQEMIATFGRDPQIRLIANLGSAVRRSEILSALDLCVYPTQEEGFGMVFVEAMHQGLPVVTYDNGANKETLGMAGVCVPWSESLNERITHMSIAVEELYRRREILMYMSGLSLSRSAYFTAEAYGDRMRKVYDNVINQY